MIENCSTPGATNGMYAAIQRAVFTKVTTWVDPCDKTGPGRRKQRSRRDRVTKATSAAENGGD
jgi:hypothetical protein